MSGRAIRIGLLAIAGLLVAAALGAAASRITSNQVGLYGEPPSVGSELVVEPTGPRDHAPARKQHPGKGESGLPGDEMVVPPPPAGTTTVKPPASADPEGVTTGGTEPEPAESEGSDSDDD